MKISKVNHTRMAVGEKRKSIKGMLYYNPAHSDKKDVQLVNHITRLNQKAQNLYKVFITNSGTNSGTKSGDKERLICVAKNTNSLIERYLRDTSSNDVLMGKLKKENHKKDIVIKDREKHGYKTVEVSDTELERIASELINMHLRKSLRKSITVGDEKIYVPEVIYDIVVNIHSGLPLSSISDDRLSAFLMLLKADYEKKEQIQKVAASIEQQQVKVQVKEKDGVYRLQLANADNPKKKELFKYVQTLANSNNNEFDEKLIRFRRLLLLYLVGDELFYDTESAGVLAWEYGMTLPESNLYISESAFQKYNDLAVLNVSEKEKQAQKKAIKNKYESMQYASIDDKQKYRTLQDEISKLKIEKKELRHTLEVELNSQVAGRYLRSIKANGLTSEDRYWLLYIEECVKKLILGKSGIDTGKLNVVYLCKEIFKEYTSFLAGKFIDMGKAVYHFAMPKVSELSGKLSFGLVLPEYQNGLTSFDYERVKAEESRERDTTVAISFALNNIANTLMSGDMKKKGIDKANLQTKDAKRKILQYFGGISSFDVKSIEEYSDEQFKDVIFEYISSLRNSNVHYTNSCISKVNDNKGLVYYLISHDLGRLGSIYRKKYYSNNVPMFYRSADINKFMSFLYAGTNSRPAQVPSFQRIVNKSSLRSFLSQIMPANALGKLVHGEADIADKYYGSIFFILKEIYYYGFINDSNVSSMFIAGIRTRLSELRGCITNLKKKGNAWKEINECQRKIDATNNFMERLNEIITMEHPDFGGICQSFMTEYNIQNSDKVKHASGDKDSDEKYAHFRMVLYDGIRIAFTDYMKRNPNISFILSPEILITDMSELSEEDFCTGWKTSGYEEVIEYTKENPLLASWYVTAHFMNPRQLNHLIGSIKDYSCYIKSVNTRAGSVDNRKDINIEQQLEYSQKVLKILELCMVYSGQISNEFTDYFTDEEEYDSFMKQFINTNKLSMKAFCNTEIKDNSSENNAFMQALKKAGQTLAMNRYGLYYDAANPKVNRNIIMAKLFGSTEKLSKSYKKITEHDIDNYYEKEKKLANIFRNGVCKDAREQIALKEYQNLKNRVELHNVLKLSEMTNDLLTRLMEWCYLRERDLMYFQLGVQYLRLLYGGDNQKRFVTLKDKNGRFEITDGAILYQIISMYTHTLPIVENVSEDSIADTVISNTTAGRCVTAFCVYCNNSDVEYKRCIGLFEILGKKDNNHNSIIDKRNSIDHIHYFNKDDYSLLDLYSYVYDQFFTYDRKLKKSVSYILKNILLRYFIITKLGFRKSATTGSEIIINDISADKLTYKFDGNKRSIEIEAVDRQYIQQVMRMLEYRR